MEINIVNAGDFAFRYENKAGPKYITRGPNLDFGIVRILPGEDFKTHRHKAVEEIFFTLSGECEIYIDEKPHLLKTGDLAQVPPGSDHYLRNKSQTVWEAVFVKSPFDPNDRIDVDWVPPRP